jgi:hypothetical protein
MKVFQRLVMPGLEEARKVGMEMIQQAQDEPGEDELEHFEFMRTSPSLSPLARRYMSQGQADRQNTWEESSGPVPHDQDPTIKELYADIAAAVGAGQQAEK